MNRLTTGTHGNLFRGSSGRAFLAFSVGWVGIQIGRHALPPLLPTIIESLSITRFEAGIALTLMWGVYAVCHYPGGRLADASSHKTVLVAGIVVVIAGVAVIAVAGVYPIFLVGMTLFGVGAGVYFITMRSYVSELFVEQRGWAFGVNMASGNVGAVLATGLTIVVVAVATWQAAFAVLIVVLVVSLRYLHRGIDQPYAIGRVSFGLRATVDRVLGDGQIRWLLFSYSLFLFAFQGFLGFLPDFLIVNKGLSGSFASGGYALLYVVGMISMPGAGEISDRFSRTAVAAGVILLGTGGVVVLLLAQSLLTVSVGLVLVAGGLMAYPPVMQTHVMEMFSDENQAGDFGVFKAVYTTVGSLGPMYVGYVASQHDYTIAFLHLIVCLLVSFAVISVISHR